jgi:site-specific DNA recombinase
VPETGDLALLDALPYLTANLREAPQPILARLYDATGLRIDLHPDTKEVTIMIKLPADSVGTITDAAHATAAGPADSRVADAVCAPGRNRTCDTRFRRAVLYPLSYEGSPG